MKNFELKEPHTVTQFVGKTMFGAYSTIVIIVLLNTLIAMLSNSYQYVSVSNICYIFSMVGSWVYVLTKINSSAGRNGFLSTLSNVDQTFQNLKRLCRTKSPVLPCLPIQAMLGFLKIYRTKQNFTGHVLWSCRFRKVDLEDYIPISFHLKIWEYLRRAGMLC